MANEFYALMGRMRYITRWGLMRNSFTENISEHSHQVAVLAHALALIRRDILKLEGPDPDRCAVAALYHDASEKACFLLGRTLDEILFLSGRVRLSLILISLLTLPLLCIRSTRK